METPTLLVVMILLGVPPLTFLALSLLSKYFGLELEPMERNPASDAIASSQKGNEEYLGAIRQVVQKCSRPLRQERLDQVAPSVLPRPFEVEDSSFQSFLSKEGHVYHLSG